MSRPSPKPLLRPALLALALAAPTLAFAAGTATPPKATDDPVVATINGSDIHRSDLVKEQQELPAQLRQVPLDQIYPQMIERDIQLKLLTKAGREQKLADDPDVKKAMAVLQDRVIAETFINRIETKAVTDAELHKRYDAMLKTYKGEDQVHARHILLATEDEAKAVIGQLDKGADFAKLANEKSTEKDLNGGDLGWFGKDQMVPEFTGAAFALQAGQYTKAPVKTKFGYHVIKVEERRVAPPPSFDEAKPDLEQQIGRDAATAELATLKQKARIVEYNLDGSPKTPAKPALLTPGTAP